MNKPRRIGLLGTGLMGRGMLVRLVNAGHTVRVFNRTRARADEAVRHAGGGQVVDTPAQAADDADVVISMLADPDAVLGSYEGRQGALSTLRRGAVIIDASTVAPSVSQRLAEGARARGATFLDAPVFGSKNEAERGELGFIVGGERAVLDSVADLFVGCLAKSVHLVGPTGSGATAKLVVNLVIALEMEALAEGLGLATRAGLSPSTMFEVLMSTRARAGIFEMKGPPALAGDFTPFFALKLMDKDLRLALEAADRLKVPMPALAAAKQVFTACMAAGQAEEDFSSIVKHHQSTSS